MEKTCGTCGKSYNSSHKRQKYCSRSCQGKAREVPPKICAYCQKPYKTQGERYCSCVCMGLAQRLTNNPNWKGGTYRPDRYKVVYNEAGKRGREHRFIVERIINRPLLPTEVVHHIDGNPENNDPANLHIVSRGEHRKEHATFRSATKKECSVCHRIKERASFSPKKPKNPTHDPHDSRCKECNSKFARLHRQQKALLFTPVHD